MAFSRAHKLVCISLLLIFSNSGCVRNFIALQWETAGPPAGYEKKKYDSWHQKPTRKLVRIIKRKARNSNYTWFSFWNPFGWRVSAKDQHDYEILLLILKERMTEPEVYQCFIDIVKGRKYSEVGRYLVSVLWGYNKMGKPMLSVFSNIYKDPSVERAVKSSVIGIFQDNEIQAPELVPLIKENLEKESSSPFYARREPGGQVVGYMQNEVRYLDWMGVDVDLKKN